MQLDSDQEQSSFLYSFGQVTSFIRPDICKAQGIDRQVEAKRLLS
uniref:Uncharacterized protein n=1 Tax=Arundo donax TaxID=35708 RepID=A0A0A9AL92_ARUDO